MAKEGALIRLILLFVFFNCISSGTIMAFLLICGYFCELGNCLWFISELISLETYPENLFIFLSKLPNPNPIKGIRVVPIAGRSSSSHHDEHSQPRGG